ncbi:hypothetical protein [Methanimicrococcus hongohii]|uniref:hypothetical protein n=1 Tax=Methanimicrococcus hongohii TaxID=3028295 RepID=UPI00292FE464|nr:hypothetical protein [Methanimicrococcus sp. Hf6]
MLSYPCLLLPVSAVPARLQLSLNVPLQIRFVLPPVSALFNRNPLALNFARLRLTKFQNGRLE